MRFTLIKKYIQFGKTIGINNNVPAKNNNKTNFDHDLKNYIVINNKIYYTGVRWECVEYVRRWLITVKHITFDNIPNAIDMFDNIVLRTLCDKRINHKSIMKKDIKKNFHLIEPGTLVIYDKQHYPITGHVAVVVDIDKINKLLYICEQNNPTNRWETSNYARKIDDNDLSLHGIILF